MFLPRKRYRQYLSSGSDASKIPKSTYYRWKREGKTLPNQVPDRPSRALNQTTAAIKPQQPVNSAANDFISDGLSVSLDEEIGSATVQIPTPSPNMCHNEIPLPAPLSEDSSGEDTDTEDDESSEDNLNHRTCFPLDHDEQGIMNLCSDNGEILCDPLNASHSGLLSPENLNQLLAPSLSVTKFETLVMIFHLVMRHGMTGVFLEDLLKYTNALVGNDDAIPGSKYLFHKLFMNGKKLDIHFFCPTCKIYLGGSLEFNEGNVVCNKCNTINTTSSLNKGNFFISMGIRDQLERMLKRQDIKILYPLQPRPEGTMSDIFDGHIYKAMQDHCRDQNLEPPLTLTFNTDGSPVYESETNSLWPIQFILNEADPKVRFNLENIMLGGIWFGSHSPIMDVFLKPFISELRLLATSGIKWTLPTGKTVESPVFALCCCTDLVAKPKVQKHHQFNGKYGCGYCLHPGVSTVVNSDKGTCALRFKADDNYPYRTDRDLRNCMKEASLLPANAHEKHVRGSLGISPLTRAPLFNLVYGFGIDWMHAVLEGVMSRLCELWFDRKNSVQPFFIGDSIGLVDSRLQTLRPPSFCRGPRLISRRVHFKANEWRSFLLFYGLPSLAGILPNIYFNHFRKLVEAIHILLRESFTHAEMQRADFLLYDFVWDFGELYEEKSMVYNVHLMLHLGKIVSMLGPLWAYSAFCFESGNGRLVKLVKGTTGVATQIARKYHMASAAVDLICGKDYTVSEPVLEFCSDIVTFKRLKYAFKHGDVTVLGRGSLLTLSNEETQMIENFEGNTGQIRVVRFFNRAVKDGVMYYGRRFARQERFDDSCVKLCDGTYAVIDLIFVDSNYANASDVWCFARGIRLAVEDNCPLASHIKEASFDTFRPLELYRINFIQKKCVFMTCGNQNYVAEFPAYFEKD